MSQSTTHKFHLLLSWAEARLGDRGYAGKLVDWVSTVLQRTLSIVKPPRKSHGLRHWGWIFECTFVWPQPLAPIE